MDTLVCLIKDFIHVDIMWCKYALVRNTLQVDIEILNSCRQSYDKCLRFSFSKKQKKQTLIAVFRIFTKMPLAHLSIKESNHSIAIAAV